MTQNRDDFQALVDPVVAFLNATPGRRPMTDWYFTDTARRRGFTARPVVVGVFLQMLYGKKVRAGSSSMVRPSRSRVPKLSN